MFDALTEGMTKIGDHKKIENEPYMALCIEVIGKRKLQDTNCLEISFAHYYSQNGDAMRDPEMIFLQARGQDGQVRYFPTYYLQDGLAIEQFSVVYDEETYTKVTGVRSIMQREQAVFAGQWACNLKDQGFIKADKAQRKPTKEISIKEFMEPIKAPLIEAGLLREEGDGSFTAPQKTMIEGSAAYNFAKAEGVI